MCTNSPPLCSPHVRHVVWLRVIGSVVIIALRGAVLLLQPGGLKREGSPLVLGIMASLSPLGYVTFTLRAHLGQEPALYWKSSKDE